MESPTINAPGGQMQAPVKPRPLWRNANYLLLWAGQAISSLGTQVSTIAFPLLVLLVTGSPAEAGIMGGVRALPYLLLSLPAGALVDRWNRKRVMALSDAGRAVALGSVAVALALGHVTTVHLYIVSAVEGTLYVFFNIAEVACLPRVVRKDQLAAANAQNMATDGVTSLLGPAFGGALYGIAIGLPFVADAISYAASVVSLLFIKVRFQAERVAERRRLRTEIAEGLVWLWREPALFFLALFTGLGNLFSAGSALVIILLAQRQGAGAVVIGVLFSIGGVGAILGAIVAPAVLKRFGFSRVIRFSPWLWTLAWPFYAVAPNAFLLGVVSAFVFFTTPIYNVAQVSYRQARLPDELQGRVNSVFRLVAFGGQPVGLALTGLALQVWGPVPTVLIVSVLQVPLALALLLNPHVRAARIEE